MRALIKFTDDLEALVEGFDDCRWINVNGDCTILRFVNDKDYPIADFPYHAVRSVDYDYDE